jgi:hypothetical protein
MVETVMIDVNLKLPKHLRKDLHDGEIICPVCEGLGVRKVDNNYGIAGEVQRYGCRYKHEAFVPCTACYNGVLATCKYCGQPNRDRRYIHAETTCLCAEAKKARDEEQRQKDSDKWDKAQKITLDEAAERFHLVYIAAYDEYVSIDELDDWLADNDDDLGEEGAGQLRIYGTSTTKLSFDAGNLVDDACGDLHDEAGDDISNSEIQELQTLLDQWAEKSGKGTTTYWPDWTIGILPETLKTAV